MCMNINGDLNIILPQIEILRDYAVLPRYPNQLGITNEHMKRAITYAKIVQEFVLKAINKNKVYT